MPGPAPSLPTTCQLRATIVNIPSVQGFARWMHIPFGKMELFYWTRPNVLDADTVPGLVLTPRLNMTGSMGS